MSEHKKFILLHWQFTMMRVDQDAIGTWPTPVGRVWQWGHNRVLIYRISR